MWITREQPDGDEVEIEIRAVFGGSDEVIGIRRDTDAEIELTEDEQIEGLAEAEAHQRAVDDEERAFWRDCR